MWRLTDERGAAAPLIAIMLVVLIGFGAIVVDVGALYVERRELQNGADAGALGIAQDCARGVNCTLAAGTATADALADANATDAASNIDAVEFPTANTVRVTTSTSAAGGTILPPTFAQVLGFGGMNVTARAAATWGAPAGLTSQLPLTISLCEWNAFTANGTSFAPPGPYPPWPAEQIITFHDTGAATCSAGPSGADLPGGFGWLSTAEDCAATTNDGGWVDDSTGAPPPNSCDDSELSAMRGQVVHVPIFDDTNGLTGANGQYHITGYAAFVLTGYRFPSARAHSLVTGTYPCSGSVTCISGFFTQALTTTTGPVSGSPSMGVSVVGMTE